MVLENDSITHAAIIKRVAALVVLLATGLATGAGRDFGKTPYPRIAMLWSPVRGQETMASMVRHDLVMSGVGAFGLRYATGPTGLAERFTPDSILRARARLAEIRDGRPDAVILVELYFYEYRDTWLPGQVFLMNMPTKERYLKNDFENHTRHLFYFAALIFGYGT